MSSYVCPECGLDYDTVSPEDAAVAVRSFPRRYREAMAGIDEDVLRRRPAPEARMHHRVRQDQELLLADAHGGEIEARSEPGAGRCGG